MREFLAHAVPSDHSPGSIQKSRALLTWGIEHMALEVIGLGTDREQITVAKEQALSGVLNAPSPFAACEAFRRFAEMLARQIASTFSQREQKIVNAIHGFVEKKGIAEVKIKELSEALHLSTGHISRVFRRTTGTTLEEYLIRQRVELAKRSVAGPAAECCGSRRTVWILQPGVLCLGVQKICEMHAEAVCDATLPMDFVARCAAHLLSRLFLCMVYTSRTHEVGTPQGWYANVKSRLQPSLGTCSRIGSSDSPAEGTCIGKHNRSLHWRNSG